MLPTCPSPPLVDLRPLHTLALRSAAPEVRVVQTQADVACLAQAFARREPVCLLGGGSNVVLPEVFHGRVWQMGLRGIHYRGSDARFHYVAAAAGESWHHFVHTCLQQGWPGLENLALIPGTVGAAPVQNIGAYGLEVAERIWRVRAWDGLAQQWRDLDPAACAFAYRDSCFKRAGAGRWIITEVTFALPRVWQPRLDYADLQRWATRQAPPITPLAVFEAVCAIRRAKLPDPAQEANAGSFFKNPVVPLTQYQSLCVRFPDLPAWSSGTESKKLAAGWLIQQAGWKGRRLGPVGMHERHALVLVNHGQGSAADVRRLVDAVTQDVFERFDIMLEVEPVWVPPGTLASP